MYADDVIIVQHSSLGYLPIMQYSTRCYFWPMNTMLLITLIIIFRILGAKQLMINNKCAFSALLGAK
jgi:hypothetical protein